MEANWLQLFLTSSLAEKMFRLMISSHLVRQLFFAKDCALWVAIALLR
jgi:hypothetical protein